MSNTDTSLILLLTPLRINDDSYGYCLYFCTWIENMSCEMTYPLLIGITSIT